MPATQMPTAGRFVPGSLLFPPFLFAGLIFLLSAGGVVADDKKDAATKAEGDQPAETDANAPPPEPPVVSIFADEALEEAVRKEVFAKRDTDQPITAEDVARISRVVGVDQKITSLEGLQHCHELMLLDLRDNAISDLAPIANLKRLQSV